MHITFDIDKFKEKPKHLINVLYWLKRTNCEVNYNDPAITEITCRTPSSAYKYAKVVYPYKLNEKVERVFIKNPNVGVRYLKFIKQKEFKNSDTQKRFWKKVLKNPEVALSWANNFGRLNNEEEEEVFMKSVRAARDYSLFVLKGKLPEKVHNFLVLKSFELDPWEKKIFQDYINYVESK